MQKTKLFSRVFFSLIKKMQKTKFVFASFFFFFCKKKMQKMKNYLIPTR